MKTDTPDPNNPTSPASFFHYYGETHIQTGGWVNLPAYTVDELYQAFILRMKAELLNTQHYQDEPVSRIKSDDVIPASCPVIPIRRKGRPPGSKNKNSMTNGPKYPAVAMTETTEDQAQQQLEPQVEIPKTGKDVVFTDCPF